MKLTLPLGISAIEISATAGEQIKVAALAGTNQVDKYLTADLSKHPNRKDKWIAEAVKIASQDVDPWLDVWEKPELPDLRTREERLIDQVLSQNTEIQQLRLLCNELRSAANAGQTESV